MKRKATMVMAIVAIGLFFGAPRVHAKELDLHYEKNTVIWENTIYKETFKLGEENTTIVSYLAETVAYVVQEGDTLSEIAEYFEVSVEEIMKLNRTRIDNPDRICAGDEIQLYEWLPKDH